MSFQCAESFRKIEDAQQIDSFDFSKKYSILEPAGPSSFSNFKIF